MDGLSVALRLILFLGLFLSEQDRVSPTGLNIVLSTLVCLFLFEYGDFPLYYRPLWPRNLDKYPPSTLILLVGLILLSLASILAYRVYHRMRPRKCTQKAPSPITWGFVGLAALMLLGPVRFLLLRNRVPISWISVPLVLLWPQTRKALLPVSYLFCWALVSVVHFNGPLISSMLFLTVSWLSLERWTW